MPHTPLSPPPSSSPTRRTSRLSRPRWALAATVIVAVGVVPAAIVTAAPTNSMVSVQATLSADTITVGDGVTVDLSAKGSDDLYAASIEVSYDADRLTFDPDSVQSGFNGLYGLVVDETTAAGSLTFSFTRLGTSPGEVGDLELGSFAFISVSAGDPTLAISSKRIVDSASIMSEDLVPVTLGLVIEALPTEEPQPSNPPTPPVRPTQPTVITGAGTGSGTTPRPVPTAPQFVLPETSAPVIELSSLEFAPGDTITIDVTGLRPEVAHEIELHSDPISLGSATTATDGTLHAEVTIPDDAPSGEHEIVVLDSDSSVAAVAVTIAERATAGVVEEGSPSDEEASTDSSAPLDAEPASSAGWIVGGLALALLVAAALVFIAVRRTRKAAHHV